LSYTPIAEIISLIPVSVSGIGTRDAVFIYFFLSENTSIESIVLLSSGILMIAYIGSGLFGALAYQLKPIALPRLKQFIKSNTE